MLLKQSWLVFICFVFGLAATQVKAHPDDDLRRAVLLDDNFALMQAIDDGANVFRRTSRDGSWVTLAATHRSIKTLSTLLLRWGELVPTEGNGETLLHLAVRFREPEAVMRLIQARIDINRPDRFGWTALHVAISLGFVDIARILLEQGARPDMRTRAGYCPVHLAAQAPEHLQLPLLLLLEQHHADMTAATFDNRNALHYAADAANERVIQYLVDRGVDARADAYAQTPFDYAQMLERIDARPRVANLSPRISAFISPRSQLP